MNSSLACCRTPGACRYSDKERKGNNGCNNHQIRSLVQNTMAVSTRSLSRSSSRQDIKSTKPSPTQSSKPADYVYFDRTTAGFSDEAVPRAKAAQLKLEHYYKVAVDAAIERNTRFSPLSRTVPHPSPLTMAFKARRAREAIANGLDDVRRPEATATPTTWKERVDLSQAPPHKTGSR